MNLRDALHGLWVGACLLAGLPANATEWAVGESAVHTRKGPADGPDTLVISGPWGASTLPFNSSRTPLDVLNGSQDGSIRLPGLVLSADADRVMRRPPRSRLPLDARTDIATSGHRITIHRGLRHCVVDLPAGWAMEDWAAERLPRDVATSTQAALLMPGRSSPVSLLPMRVDLNSCQVSRGRPIKRIGFDVLLQGHAGGWWLTSAVENTLLISTDGIRWKPMPLPQATHALLGAHVAPDGQAWVAVSQSDIGFRLRAYRRDGLTHGWTQATMCEVPRTWVDFARLVAEDRLTDETPQPCP